MFDLTSSKLLILAVIALIVVGPKDLPVLLRAVGKYIGIIRRQANEFRQYFDEAMREQELATLRAEVDAMKRDVQATVSSAGRALEADIAAVKSDVEAASGDVNRSIQPPSTSADAPPQAQPALASSMHTQAVPIAPVTDHPAETAVAKAGV
ncbi:MAG: Sec-independent protein translocase protein TatB [Hyphomicrobiaceae bacterium]|nr:Sec-independent protein translocase protein TatB [Hyphomicrobiaceae bacterium]